jgi:hypothetical protein
VDANSVWGDRLLAAKDKANGEKEVCQKEVFQKAGSEEEKTEWQGGSVTRCGKVVADSESSRIGEGTRRQSGRCSLSWCW